MSDTPRTDELTEKLFKGAMVNGWCFKAIADHARELERELRRWLLIAEQNATDADRWRRLYQHATDAAITSGVAVELGKPQDNAMAK